MTYVFTDDYKTDLHEHITQLYTLAKTLNTSRGERLQASDDLVEDYYAHTELVPDGTALERLATLILRDELSDMHPDKVTREEYPILSDRQLETRDDKETKVSDIVYGNDKTVGFRKVHYEDTNGTTQTHRKRIYDFPK